MRYDIALVMVCHDDLNEEALHSIHQAIVQSHLRCQLVVVDNASRSFVANEVVDRCVPGALTILRHGDFGFGRSCNRGARELEAEFVFVLNADIAFPDPTVLDRLHAFARAHPNAGIFAPKITHFDGTLQETCRRFPAWFMPIVSRTGLGAHPKGREVLRRFHLRDYDHVRPRLVDWAQGSALFLPKTWWDTLGGFDERFWMYFEDMDLCRRSWESGRPVYYVPEAAVAHGYGRESAKMPGLLPSLFQNRMARAHISSWVKYLWKWLPHPLPKWS